MLEMVVMTFALSSDCEGELVARSLATMAVVSVSSLYPLTYLPRVPFPSPSSLCSYHSTAKISHWSEGTEAWKSASRPKAVCAARRVTGPARGKPKVSLPSCVGRISTSKA